MSKLLSDVTTMMEGRNTAARDAALKDLVKRHGAVCARRILATAADWRAVMAKDGGFTESAIIWMEEAEFWRTEAAIIEEEIDNALLTHP